MLQTCTVLERRGRVRRIHLFKSVSRLQKLPLMAIYGNSLGIGGRFHGLRWHLLIS